MEGLPLETVGEQLTAVADDAFSGVALSKTSDGGEADQVGFWFDEFSQVVGQQLPLLDASFYRNLLLPPTRLTHLSKTKKFRNQPHSQARVLQTHLSEAQSIGQDPVHSAGLHLGPLQLEAVGSRSVLPQSAASVVVKLRSVSLT